MRSRSWNDCGPNWFAFITYAAEPTVDLFETVERRVRGGMVLGVGLALVAIPTLRLLWTSIPTGIFYFATGALAARRLGIVVDGAVPKQWRLVGVEPVIMAYGAHGCRATASRLAPGIRY